MAQESCPHPKIRAHVHYMSHMVAEQVLDIPVPQVVEQLLEVPKIIPQGRIRQRTANQIVDLSEAKRADLAEAEKDLATLVANQAVSNGSCTQVAPDHEDYVKACAEELKAVGHATKVLQLETDGAEEEAHSLFQDISRASLQAVTDLEGLKVVTTVRRLAAQRANCRARSADLTRQTLATIHS